MTNNQSPPLTLVGLEEYLGEDNKIEIAMTLLALASAAFRRSNNITAVEIFDTELEHLISNSGSYISLEWEHDFAHRFFERLFLEELAHVEPLQMAMAWVDGAIVKLELVDEGKAERLRG